ncbi:MAG: hypothetical protein WBW33_28090 [Bryobacteraceae bacterium]
MLLLLMMTAQSGQDPGLEQLIRQIAESGRVTEAGETPDQRVATKPQIAPGAPPLLSFRYYEGKQHHRFGDMDLVLDDAGH